MKLFGFLGLVAGLSGAIASQVSAERIEIPGTGDGMTILRELAETFSQANPGDEILLPPSVGSSGGIKAVGLERARLGRVARRIKEREQPYGLSYLPIARFPVVFFVNQDVCITDLSADQINDIYRGRITNWKAVGGNDNRIRVIRREQGDSSLNNLRATFPGFRDVEITKFSKVTPTTQMTIDAVADISGSIAFGPYSDALPENVYVLTVNGTSPLDDAYPSYGVLALVYREEDKHGLVSDFIDFVLSPDGERAIRAANASPYR